MKNMHKGWKEDTPETHATVFKNDYANTLIDDLLTEPKENTKVQTEIMCMMPIFLDIFHYL